MIIPRDGAELKMEWDGQGWKMHLKNFHFEVESLEQVCVELGDLVKEEALDRFNVGRVRPMPWWVGPVDFGGGVLAQRERPKFRGNK